MGKARIYDPPLTLRIVNTKICYDLTNDYKLFRSYSTNTNRKNGYLAYDMDGEELGVIYESDGKQSDNYYQCAQILFFKNYSAEHGVGVWRVIVPTDLPRYVNRYIPFADLERILSEKGSLVVTTKETRHYPKD